MKQCRTHRKHLVGLIKDEHLHIVRLQDSSLNHVLDTTRGSHDDLGTILQSLHILTDVGATDASMTFNVHEVANSDDDFLDLLSKLARRRKDQSLACFEVLVNLL